MDNRRQPFFFAFDTRSKPGKVVAHCIRLETIEIDPDPFEQTNFELMGPGCDPRMKLLLECFKGGEPRLIE
jgi:hypothetical protein